jgi:soluble lytic murein transglycosylase-like protein
MPDVPASQRGRGPATALLLALTLTAGPLGAQTIWTGHAIDPLLLYAIALQESQRLGGDGLVRPWPWTLNTREHGALRFESFEAARARLEALLAEGIESVDVGLMQVNYRYHGHRFAAPAHMLDPRHNIRAAVAILEEHLAADADLTRAVARYHSARKGRGTRYAAAVLALQRALARVPGLRAALSAP